VSDIFLSYSKEDRGFVERLSAAFESMGWSVWWDHNLEPGQDFSGQIETQIDAARLVVVLWSRSSVQKDFVKNEARAGNARKALFPALIERDVVIPIDFNHLQAPSLIGWEGRASEESFSNIETAIRTRIGPPSGSRTAAKPAGDRDQLEDALGAFDDFRPNVNFFIGPGSLSARPFPRELTTMLLRNVGLIGPMDEDPRPLATAATYFSIKNSERELYNVIEDLLHTGMRSISGEFRTLAQIIIELNKRPLRTRRSEVPHVRIVVTTRIDLALERAFIEQGLSFTRLIPTYDSTLEKSRLTLERFRQCSPVEGGYRYTKKKESNMEDAIALLSRDVNAIDDFIRAPDGAVDVAGNDVKEMSLDQGPHPILYKLGGSVEFGGVVSLDHQARCVARIREGLLPYQVRASIQNSRCLLLGYWQGDGDFHLLNHSLLAECDKLSSSLAVASFPDGFTSDPKMETALWSFIKARHHEYAGGMRFVEAPVGTALTAILQRLKSA
jgi:hypothetical protein